LNGIDLQRASPWYSGLGSIPVAEARRLEELYMDAISAISQMSSSLKPYLRRGSTSAVRDSGALDQPVPLGYHNLNYHREA